jgi:hypothetical protein
VLRFYQVDGNIVTPEEMAFFTATASCEPGDVAVSGGYRTVTFGDAAPTILSSASFTGSDWTVEGRVNGVSVGSLVAQVICAELSS